MYSKFSWWKILSWVGWLLWLWLMLVGIDWEKVINNNFYPTFIITAIWLWGSARWIAIHLKKEEREKVQISFLRILLINIIAPTIVGIILYQVTGNTSITLFSVPVIGLLSASLNIG